MSIYEETIAEILQEYTLENFVGLKNPTGIAYCTFGYLASIGVRYQKIGYGKEAVFSRMFLYCFKLEKKNCSFNENMILVSYLRRNLKVVS